MALKLLAAGTPIYPDGFRGLGPLGNETGANPFDLAAATGKFELALSVTLGVMTIIGGLWFMYQVFIGAIEWLSSGGEKQSLQNAQKRITNAVIGLLVIVTAYGFILAAGNVLGLKSLLNPATIIPNLHP